MIKEIMLKNFQSHPGTKLKFSPGVNAIIGESDTGKSAIMRAFFWCIFNRPAGDVYISDWAKTEKGNLKKNEEIRVTIKDEKSTVERFKDGTDNGYVIDDKVLKAINRDVPEDIELFFNMGDVNIQRQLDAPFLLSNTPGEIARFFNQTIKLDSVDAALTKIDSAKRKTNADLKSSQSALEETEKLLSSFEWVPFFSDCVQLLETLTKDKEKQTADKQKIVGLVSELKKCQQTLDQLPDTGHLNALASQASEIMREAQGLFPRFSKLTSLVSQYVQANAALSRTKVLQSLLTDEITANRYLQEYRDLKARSDSLRALTSTVKDLTEKVSKYPDTTGLEAKITTAEKYKTMYNLKSDMLKEITKMLNKNSAHLSIIKESSKELEALMKELPDTCPTCGKAL